MHLSTQRDSRSVERKKHAFHTWACFGSRFSMRLSRYQDGVLRLRTTTPTTFQSETGVVAEDANVTGCESFMASRRSVTAASTILVSQELSGAQFSVPVRSQISSRFVHICKLQVPLRKDDSEPSCDFSMRCSLCAGLVRRLKNRTCAQWQRDAQTTARY